MDKVNKKKNKSVPMTKSSKKTLIICLGILLLIGIIFLIGMFNPTFAEFFWFNIRNLFVGLGFKIFQFCPWIGAWHNMLLVLIMWIFIIYAIGIELSKKIEFKKKVKIVNKYYSIVFIFMVVIMGPIMIDFTSLNNSKINERYFSDNINEVYDQEDIIQLANYFKNNIFKSVHSFDRIDGEIVYSEDLTERAVSDLLNISDKYLFLKGMYPNKVSDFFKLERIINNDGTLGYTKGFGIVVDYNQNNVALINTITHEMCHAKGIFRESEAEFCAYIANASSEDVFSNYSANYNAFYRLVSALSYIDLNISLDVEESFTNLCLSNEYSEACNFYNKQLDVFVEGTDEYELVSHRLRNYKDYSNGFMEMVSHLIRNYDAKIYVGEKEVNLDYINSGIRSGSKDILNIKIDANKKKFLELSKFLSNYQKYMLAFYQTDNDIEEDDFLVGEEALEYYVKPFDLEDRKNLLNDKWVDEYYYERVTRLLLEYYNDVVKK